MPRIATMHRVDEADVVHAPPDVRKEITDLDPALAVFAETPKRLENLAGAPLIAVDVVQWDRLVVVLLEQRLVVERVHVGGTALHETEDHRPGPRCQGRRPCCKWIGGTGDLVSPYRLIPRQQRREGELAESDRGLLQQLAARDHAVWQGGPGHGSWASGQFNPRTRIRST